MSLDPVHLTRSLVDIESITYNEGAVGLWLEGYLDGLGFGVERTPVAQPSDSRYSGERFNLYASITVVNPTWSFPRTWIPSHHSSPAVKMRSSSMAAAVATQGHHRRADRRCGAFARTRRKGGLLFVVGEERDSAGARVANETAKGSRFLINGEPTDNRLAWRRKGALRATFRATGKMGHSAYPELGDSAIHKLIHALEEVLALKLPFVEDVGPGTLNIGIIQGGHAPNVIADTAEAHALVRLVGPSDEVRAAIESAVAGLATVDFTLEIPFVRMRKIEGLATMVAAFTTDIPALTNWGEPLLLGPGSIHVAHTPHERWPRRNSSKRSICIRRWRSVCCNEAAPPGHAIRPSLKAVGAGWAAAMVATLPMQIAKIVANSFRWANGSAFVSRRRHRDLGLLGPRNRSRGLALRSPPSHSAGARKLDAPPSPPLSHPRCGLWLDGRPGSIPGLEVASAVSHFGGENVLPLLAPARCLRSCVGLCLPPFPRFEAGKFIIRGPGRSHRPRDSFTEFGKAVRMLAFMTS